MRYLLNEALPEQSGLVSLLAPNSTYAKALVFIDENEYLFLCFSRLQYPDAEAVASRLLAILGETPTALFHSFGDFQAHFSEEIPFSPRIASDILHLTKPFAKSTTPLGAVINSLFEKTEDSFSALGYGIQSEISPDWLSAHPADISLFDFLFLYGTLLYSAMKLSKKGKISVSLTSDPKEEAHLFSFETVIARDIGKDADVFSLLREIAPECAFEFALWQACFAEKRISLSLSQPSPKTCTLTCHLPYLAPSHTVHSPLFEEENYEYLMDMFARIQDMLWENLPI